MESGRSRPPALVARGGSYRWRHALLLLLCAFPWLLGPWLEVSAKRATLAGISGPICLFGHLFSAVGCPGCGLTRSIGLALRGEVAASIAMNPAGILVLFVAAAGMILQADLLRRGATPKIHRRCIAWGKGILIGGLLASWSLRIAQSM